MFDDNLEEINKELRVREITGIVKQCVDADKVTIRWISTKENIADILTKPLPLDAFKYLRDKISKLD